MSAEFDPYLKWLGIGPQDQPPNHYRLLGIDLFTDDPDVIESAADRQMAHIRTFQAGRHVELSQRVLNEIANAKVCLLDPDKKTEYDRLLAAERTMVVSQPAATTRPLAAMPPPSTISSQEEKPFTGIGRTAGVNVSAVGDHTRRSPRKKSHLPVAISLSVIGLVCVVVVGLIVALKSSPGTRRPLAERPTKEVHNLPARIRVRPAEAPIDDVPSADRPIDQSPAIQTLPPQSDDIVREAYRAVQSEQTDETAIVGGAHGPFEDVGGLLVGLDVATGKYGAGYRHEAVGALTPIYRTPSGIIRGETYGPATAKKVTLIAEDGYAVGEIKVNATEHPRIVGLQIVFLKINGSKLDPEDYYSSPPYLIVSEETPSVGGDGRPVVGVFGGVLKQELRGLGLIQIKCIEDAGSLPSATEPRPNAPSVEQVQSKPPTTPETNDPASALQPEQPHAIAADSRHPLPDSEALQQALAIARDVFQSESRTATTPEEKIELAQKIIRTAIGTKDDLAAQYVLLRIGRDLAAAAGDVALAMDAVDTMSERFQVDSGELVFVALVSLTKAVRTMDQYEKLDDRIATVIAGFMRADNYDPALQFAAALVESARRLEDIALIKQAVAKQREIEAAAARFRPIRQALSKLEDDPDNADANLVVGMYRCVVKGDWKSGSLLLARGSDPSLKAAAELETAEPQDADHQVEVGDAWWSAAEGRTENEERQLQARAAHWYREALVELAPGLTRTKIEQRLAKVKELQIPSSAEEKEPGMIERTIKPVKQQIPKDAVKFNGHSYCLSRTRLTWHEAQKACEGLGGHLARIESAEEQAFAVRLLRAVGRGRLSHAWIDGSDAAQEGVWLYSDGQPLGYTAWNPPREPTNSYDGEHVAAMIAEYDFRWGDLRAEQAYHFLCEWD